MLALKAEATWLVDGTHNPQPRHQLRGQADPDLEVMGYNWVLPIANMRMDAWDEGPPEPVWKEKAK